MSEISEIKFSVEVRLVIKFNVKSIKNNKVGKFPL